MKSKVFAIMIATLLFSMPGCELVGPRVKVEGPKVKIPVVQVEGSGKHCPPGQAKKGRC